MLKFVPPKEEATKYPRYASFAAGEMKLHHGVGFAKNSLNNRMWERVGDGTFRKGWNDREVENTKLVTKHAFLLENVEGEWFTLYEIKPGLTKNELPWMKEYYYGYYHWTLLTDYERNHEYYSAKIKSGEYPTQFRPTKMTTDEYVEWRLAVELERRGIS